MAYTTKQSLLEAIRSNSEISWQEFYNTYRPLIVFFAKRENLSLEEIEDLVQTVMVKVFKMQERFRDYLGTVIHNAIVDLYRAKRRSLDYAAMEMANVPGIDSFEKIWCKEWQNHVFEQALIQVQNTVQETTFQAFQLSVLEQRPVQEVADFLQISVQNVYEAKSRCIAQLRKKAKVLAEED